MASVCRHCKAEAFDQDEQVCTSCGVVNENVSLQLDSHSSTTFLSNESRKKNFRLDSLSSAIEALGHVCHRYNILSDVRTEATTLLSSIYSMSRTNIGKSLKKFRRKEDVCALAGCCLITVLEKYGDIITINDLCSVLKCTKKSVYKMTKVVKSFLAKHPLPFQENISLCRNSNELSEEQNDNGDKYSDKLHANVTFVLSKLPDDIKNKLLPKTIALVKLAESCWILTGRSTIGVSTAAAFLCWKSVFPHQNMNLKAFCSNYGLNLSKASLRIPELRNMLLKLSKNIPSVTKNYINHKNILFHLDYILENSETLRNDLFVHEFSEDVISQKEFEMFRSPFVKKKLKYNSQPLNAVDDFNASDVEISDTEISSYIRTAEQVNMIKRLKKIKGLPEI